MHRHKSPRLLVPLTLLSLFIGCAPVDEKPDNLIPADKMANVLAEIHIAESKVSRLNIRSTDSANVVYKRLERGIFKKFAVDTSAYNKSYAYYSSHPAELEALYQQVVAKLQKQSSAKHAPADSMKRDTAKTVQNKLTKESSQ